MMQKLLQLAMESADQAEVYSYQNEGTNLSMRGGLLTETSSTIQSGVALRIIRNGFLGAAYTKNLIDRAELVRNALASLEGRVEAAYRFPGPTAMPAPPEYCSSVEKLTYSDIYDTSREISDYLSGRAAGQVDTGGGFSRSSVRIMNSSGLDCSFRTSGFGVGVSILFPNTETSVFDTFLFREKTQVPVAWLDRQAELYNASLPEVDVKPGRMRVIFMPFTMFTLLWRLKAASSGKAFHMKTTPLLDKVGQKVVSEKFTLLDDPLDPDNIQSCRPFDDEGVPCSTTPLLDRGVFKGPYVNLDYAAKLGIAPTGHGFRGDEPVSTLPAPNMQAAMIVPGDRTFEEIVEGTERGVLLMGVLGAHSGNILNGDFSVGMNPGVYVENGRIVGRVRDGMVAGNAWDVLGRVSAVQDRPFSPHGFYRYPCVAADDVSVTGRS
jgi:PmbA protein